MGRMYDHIVTKRQDLLVQAVVQLVRETRCVLMAQQIGTGDRAHQQATPAEEHRRLGGFDRVLNQVANVLGCVARRREDPEQYVADGERVAVANGVMVELQARIRAGDDARANQGGQLAAAAHKIVVDMCLEDVRDTRAFGLRGVDVVIDVAQWIDQRSNTMGLRNHQMGAVAQALVDELAYSHR